MLVTDLFDTGGGEKDDFVRNVGQDDPAVGQQVSER
jgi:hypothetical protein